QLCLENLPVVVFRQSLEESVRLGPFETCDVLQAERVESFRVYRARGHDERHHLFTPFRVRPSDHRRLANSRMPQQHFLDLPRVDVAAATDDQILRAVSQGEETVLVQRTQVPGLYPAPAQPT